MNRFKNFSRRDFMKYLGAFGAGTTLLGSTRLAFGAEPADCPAPSTASGPPRRFVFIVEGNCVEPAALLNDVARAELEPTLTKPIDGRRWWYNQYDHSARIISNGGLETAPALASLLGDGIEPSLIDKSQVIFGLSNRIAGGGHSSYSGGLSCSRPAHTVPGSVTFDAYLASLEAVRRGSPFDALRLGVEQTVGNPNARLNFGTCAYAKGRPAPLLVQPVDGFNYLFSSVGSPEQQLAFERRSELLSFAADSTAESLACFKGGPEERAKLTEYQLSINDLLCRQQALLDMGPTLEAVRPEDPSVGGTLNYSSTNPMEQLQVHMHMIRAGLVGGLTNVAVLGIGTSNRFDLAYPGISGLTRHDLHHESGKSSSLVSTIHQISGEYVSMAAWLARELEAIPEGDGTMLDNTVIVYMGDNGEQHHSTASEWPILLIGGEGMGLTPGGRTIFYPGIGTMNHRHLSNLFVTLANSAGSPIDSFGTDGTAPKVDLPELYDGSAS